MKRYTNTYIYIYAPTSPPSSPLPISSHLTSKALSLKISLTPSVLVMSFLPFFPLQASAKKHIKYPCLFPGKHLNRAHVRLPNPMRRDLEISRPFILSRYLQPHKKDHSLPLEPHFYNPPTYLLLPFNSSFFLPSPV